MIGFVKRIADGLSLLPPALIPSWRFFDVIAPSPRIEYALLCAQDDPPHWREFRPRPATVSPMRMFARLFWNPVWNEQLFLVSCAERIMEAPTEHSQQEIFKRIQAELLRSASAQSASYLQFRLVLVNRQKDRLEKEIAFVSAVRKFTVGESCNGATS